MGKQQIGGAHNDSSILGALFIFSLLNSIDSGLNFSPSFYMLLNRVLVTQEASPLRLK